MRVLPHVTGLHREIPESHVFEDILQMVDEAASGTRSAAGPEHARHVIGNNHGWIPGGLHWSLPATRNLVSLGPSSMSELGGNPSCHQRAEMTKPEKAGLEHANPSPSERIAVYRPSPRPNPVVPTLITRSGVTRHIWGDQDSGLVADWIYASTELIHLLVFGLAPGGSFPPLKEFRTVFAADEVLCVLSGSLMAANPETGEVVTAETGDFLFFRRDTWHHVFARGPEPLRVLEFFSPPPSAGTSGAYSRTRPFLEESTYRRRPRPGKRNRRESAGRLLLHCHTVTGPDLAS
ncbi:MAG: cupin domain-containing protein [Nocardioidaceae bacterium]